MKSHKHRLPYKKLKHIDVFFKLKWNFLKKRKKLKKIRKENYVDREFKLKKKYYLPNLKYLTTKFQYKRKNVYRTTIEQKRIIKYWFGFYRTQLLKKILKQQKKKKKNRYSLRQLELYSIFEKRLDVLLLKLGFVSSIHEAKQLISHKKVLVNNNRTGAFSRLLKKGDIVSFDPACHILIKKKLKNKFKKNTSPFILKTSHQIEISYNTLRFIILTDKINIFSSVWSYNILIDWKKIQ